GLELAIILAVTGPIAVFTLPFAGGPWTTLLLGAIIFATLSAIWRGADNLDGHLRAGAEVMIEVIRRQAAAGPAALTSEPEPETAPASEILLPGVGHVEAVTVGAGRLVGRTLGELDLYSRTGAAVLALVRADESIP